MQSQFPPPQRGVRNEITFGPLSPSRITRDPKPEPNPKIYSEGPYIEVKVRASYRVQLFRLLRKRATFSSYFPSYFVGFLAFQFEFATPCRFFAQKTTENLVTKPRPTFFSYAYCLTQIGNFLHELSPRSSRCLVHHGARLAPQGHTRDGGRLLRAPWRRI